MTDKSASSSRTKPDIIALGGFTLNRPVVCVDIETTSVNIAHAKIIQFAAIQLPGDSVTFMCNPMCKVDEEAVKVNGITNEMLNAKPPFEYYKDTVVDMLSDLMCRS